MDFKFKTMKIRDFFDFQNGPKTTINLLILMLLFGFYFFIKKYLF
ncbi:hypothetical protein RC62_4493 [Flavobacterium aquidurense]|uniref:Uncharacterized protein n=1 Tax=Flavobacterium aquidurense TaxID=362413 RepID=A0A0Q0WXW4_9FLAO|nr:hypothetical protein RC62_4493 [Flavobacterium aquidurense]